MKKIFSNNRVIAIAFLTVFSLSMTPVVMGNDKNPSVPVEMKYAGLMNKQPVFELSFSGTPDQDEFTIAITDEFGNSLYRENIKGQHFTKKFLLNTNEIGDNLVRFEVSCKKTKQTVTYEVNRQTRFEEEIMITRVK